MSAEPIKAWSAKPGELSPSGRCPRGHDAVMIAKGPRYVECSECGLILTASRPTATVER